MKVLHVPYTWFPDEVGGTEYYVRDLCEELAGLGVQNVVAAPGSTTGRVDGDTPVRRFPVPYLGRKPFLEELYGAGSVAAAATIGRIMDDVGPDVVHLHSYTRGCGLGTLRTAKGRGLPVVFTYHTPTVSCPRGTLLRWGTEVCDGRLDALRCGACVFESRGAPKTLASAGARAAALFGTSVGAFVPKAAQSTLLLPALLEGRNRALMDFLNGADRLVAPSVWVKKLLEGIGVDGGVIRQVPQGLSGSGVRERTRRAAAGGPLEVVVAGRASFEKGLDLVPAALRLMPGAAVRVKLFAAVQGTEDEKRLATLCESARHDARLCVTRSAPRAEVLAAMRAADVALVPSRVLETGPLVVLEAFASGVPVVGARLGGIAERVTEGVDGLLFEVGNPAALAEALERLVADRSLLAELRRGVTSPPSMADVASTMRSVYRELHCGE